jgi:hypothetical protein
MKNSWTKTFRRLAAGAMIVGSSAMSSAMCYAQVAYDDASDVVYADGWQAGDNGGFGFGPWDFSGTYNSPIGQAMDDGQQLGVTGSTPYNDIDRAWTLFNALGPEPGPAPDEGTDISQAGRAIVGGLQVGRTFTTIIDNPSQRNFFRGYTVRLNTGGGNTVFAGTPSTRFAIGTFEYGTNGQWYSTDGSPTLADVDTDAGMQFDFTLTSPNTFSMVMTPLDNLGAAYSDSGTLDGTGPIDWIEFEFFNTDSDWNPSMVANPQSTDFYIRSISIVPEPGSASLLLLGAGSVLGLARSRHRRD